MATDTLNQAQVLPGAGWWDARCSAVELVEGFDHGERGGPEAGDWFRCLLHTR
jgi:hypothetical protein